MSERVKRADVDERVEEYTEALVNVGLLNEGEKLVLHAGNSTSGYGWKLYRESGHGAPGLSSGMLGATAKEAERALYARLLLLWALEDAKTAKERNRA